MVLPDLRKFLSWILRPPLGYDVWLNPATMKMIVPDLTGLSSATATLETTASSPAATSSPTNLVELTKSLRKFGKANALLQAPTGALRTIPLVNNETLKGLQDRQSCTSGTAFYSCANGFNGCCSVDPCNPGGGCPDGTTSSTQAASSATSTHSSTASTHSTTTSHSTTKSNATHTSTASTIVTESISATTTAPATATAAIANPAPACPGGNMTTFTDSSNLAYVIHCNADNSYSSDQTIQVGTGGYSECFSACSLSTACAGFTYNGLDSGSCYLKTQMPSGDYVAKAGSNYVSCAKVNATASAPSTSPKTSPAKKSSTGAIAGGVVGGLIFLGLLLLLVALIAKHHRKKIEERRATVLFAHHGPIETLETTNSPKHGRSGSTAHDAFAPFGGFYRGADGFIRNASNTTDGSQQKTPNQAPSSLFPGYRAEDAVYKQHSNPSADVVAMLDGTPIKRPLSSQGSGKRSPRFTEHLSEMEDTSRPYPSNRAAEQSSPLTPNTDSPTLGRVSGVSLADETRRKQHLLSFNDYQNSHIGHSGEEQGSMSATMKSPPTAMSPDQVSPDLSSGPRESSFVVSPLGSLNQQRSYRE